MTYPKPIKILKYNEETQTYDFFISAHARINTEISEETTKVGAIRTSSRISIELRYNKKISEIEWNTELFKIVYGNAEIEIKGYDDFMQKHKNIKLSGVARRIHG